MWPNLCGVWVERALIFTKRVAEKVNCSNSLADPPAGKNRACAEGEGDAFLYSDTCYVLWWISMYKRSEKQQTNSSRVLHINLEMWWLTSVLCRVTVDSFPLMSALFKPGTQHCALTAFCDIWQIKEHLVSLVQLEQDGCLCLAKFHYSVDFVLQLWNISSLLRQNIQACLTVLALINLKLGCKIY